MQENRNTLISVYEKSFRNIYTLNTLINLVMQICEDRENKAIYYGLSKAEMKKLSEERNDYINVLNIISEKISEVVESYLIMEKEIMLYQNSDNSGR